MAGSGILAAPARGVFKNRLFYYRFWFRDTVQDVSDSFVPYGVEIVWDLNLDLSAVLAGNHGGEAVRRHGASECLREDYRIGGDKAVGIVIDASNSDAWRSVTPHHTDLLRRSGGG